MDDDELSAGNWEALLLATLSRARDQLPTGPFTEEQLAEMPTADRHRAALGQDIDQLFRIADNRGMHIDTEPRT